MKTKRFEFVAKVITFCAKNESSIHYDENVNTHELEFIEIDKYLNGKCEWFGVYIHRTKIEFWINDNNDAEAEHSDRYIFECSEDDCYRYIQNAVYHGYEYIIRNYSNNITDKI